MHATLIASERVACGGTAPRGNNNPSSSRPSVSPLAFLRGVKKAGLTTFDAWAHHPYYAGPSDTPTTRPVSAKGAPATAVTLGNLTDLTKEVTRLYGNKRIWITEYGYQTNPPDPVFGVSYAKQAAYLTQAFGIARKNPRIDMMLWFLLRQPRDRLAANIEHLRDDDFIFVPHDLTQHVEIAEPVDFVYHLASPASPIDYLRLPLQTLKVGSQGTHNALGLAKAKRARFLLASTSEVYGDPQVHPQPETYWGHVNPIGPRGVYDEAKRYAEALTMAYHRQQGVDTAIVRIFNTYGPRMRPHDGRAIPTFIRQALEEKPLTVFGDGSQTRSFCFVDDLVRGLILLAESGEHLPVNIGNPIEMTLLQLAEAVIRLSGSSSPIVYEALPVDDPQVRQPDITRATQLLGWSPEVELDEGLRRTLLSLGRDSVVA